MRDYIHQEVQNRRAYGRFTAVVRFVKNWTMRKDLKTLLRMSDYQLRDIGLTRAELCRLVDLPVSRDLAWEFERTNTPHDCGELADAYAQAQAGPKAAEPMAPPMAALSTGRK